MVGDLNTMRETRHSEWNKGVGFPLYPYANFTIELDGRSPSPLVEASEGLDLQI